MTSILNFDANILYFVQDNMRAEPFTALMKFMSLLGNAGIIWIIIGIALLFFKKQRKMGAVMLICIALAWVIDDGILKNAFARPRPFLILEGLNPVVKLPSSYSFPSGHTAIGFCASIVFTKFRGKKGALAYILAALIAFSRIYVGVHYPTDVIGGIIIGTLWGALFSFLIIKFLDKPLTRLLHVPEGK